MTGSWKPGTVAVAAVRGVPNLRVVRSASAPHDRWVTIEPVAGVRYHEDREVTEVRPLVVLDVPESRSARILVEDLRHAWDVIGNGRLRDLADQIEAQTSPPKPEEPTGLGAVVEDAEGERWVRVNQSTGTQEWRCCDFNGEFRRWPDIAAVRVLSEGVTQ